MAKAKSSNLALIRGPRRYLEGSYREVPPTFVYHYTFKQVGNTVIVANAALPIQLTPKLTLSQLVAKFPNKTLDDLILENAKSKSGWTRATPEQAEQYRKIKAQHDAYCLKAFAQRAKARLAQPAAQQGVAYAELPEKYYLAGGEVPTWDAKQMHAFADATHTLRASHEQASSQAGEYPALVCDYCGALTPDPWHSSGMLHGKMSKHIHSCDACAARGVAKAQDTREPLTPEQIQDLLLCGNPTDEEMRLIRIGWDAAIRTQQPAPAQPEYISREDWIEQAVRVYLIAGDTDEQAQECAAYLWGELDMDDLADPYDAAMSDIEGRDMPRKETQ